jgi:RNA polymerase sigma-70 factor, ECF subfamily
MSIEQIYREESGRILATLTRLLGDFDLAEEALQESFAAALVQWPKDGTPGNPRAWLVSTGRNKAVHRLRRQARFECQRGEWERQTELADQVSQEPDESMLGDDRLRLIFTCCHPAISTEAQVSLTLRTLCGLGTEEIAREFLVPLPTMAQRIVRAQHKIRDARIPYNIQSDEELPARIEDRPVGSLPGIQ